MVHKVNEWSYRHEPSWSVDSFAISERSESVSLLLLQSQLHLLGLFHSPVLHQTNINNQHSMLRHVCSN